VEAKLNFEIDHDGQPVDQDELAELMVDVLLDATPVVSGSHCWTDLRGDGRLREVWMG
jgi:hypothetical protein